MPEGRVFGEGHGALVVRYRRVANVDIGDARALDVPLQQREDAGCRFDRKHPPIPGELRHGEALQANVGADIQTSVVRRDQFLAQGEKLRLEVDRHGREIGI